MKSLRSIAVLACLAVAPLAAASELETVAPGIWLKRGAFVPGSQPDGNTVVLRGRKGLIVVDTGRHREHTDAVLDFAAATRQGIAAVINTHWHLDHIGGNPAVRAKHAGVAVYATGALDDALHGFLADYRTHLEGAIARAGSREEETRLRNELAIIEAGPRLAPDHVVAKSGRMKIGGRRLNVHVERYAVTAGDLWLFDAPSRVLIAGDLVTLPAPFLDTACPEGWKAALERLARTEFRLLIPGHGAPMERPAFERYRMAFGNLLDCGAGSESTAACSERWLADTGDLVPASDHAFTTSMVAYYVDNHLRGDPARNAKLCGR